MATSSIRRSATAQEKPHYSAPALDKGLSILEFLASDGRGHTQTEICRHLGKSQSEIFRMLSCLEQREYIRRGLRDERYRLSSKLFEMCYAHPPSSRVIDLALPCMRRFSQQAEQSCHLVIHQGHRAVVIAQVDSPLLVRVSVGTGRVLELDESASGRVLAAFQPEDLQSSMLYDIKETISSRRYQGLLKRLEKIRAAGHEISASGIIDGVTDLSVPIVDHQGHALATLTVPCVAPVQKEKTIRRVLALLHETAGEMSQAIGTGTHEYAIDN